MPLPLKKKRKAFAVIVDDNVAIEGRFGFHAVFLGREVAKLWAHYNIHPDDSYSIVPILMSFTVTKKK